MEPVYYTVDSIDGDYARSMSAWAIWNALMRRSVRVRWDLPGVSSS